MTIFEQVASSARERWAGQGNEGLGFRFWFECRGTQKPDMVELRKEPSATFESLVSSKVNFQLSCIRPSM